MRLILQRYIFREMMIPMGVGIGVFTFAFMMGKVFRLVDMMVEHGVPLSFAARLFLCLTPSFLVFVTPMAFLLAVLIALGRLSADREILAMKASGVGVGRVIPPVILLATITSIFTALLVLYGVPYGSKSFKKTLFGLAQAKIRPSLREGVFNDAFPRMVIYAEKVSPEGDIMENVMVYHEEGGRREMIFARRGYLLAEPEKRRIFLRFERGTLHQEEGTTYSIMDFQLYDFNLSYEKQLLLARHRTGMRLLEKGMSVADLKEKIKDYIRRGKSIRPLLVELHFKFAIPFAALVFGLLGIPLGLYQTRSGKSWGFVLSIFVVLIYYVMYCLGKAMAAGGLIPPWSGAWLPNLFMASLGGYLLLKASRESPVLALELLDRLMEGIRTVSKQIASERR